MSSGHDEDWTQNSPTQTNLKFLIAKNLSADGSGAHSNVFIDAAWDGKTYFFNSIAPSLF